MKEKFKINIRKCFLKENMGLHYRKAFQQHKKNRKLIARN